METYDLIRKKRDGRELSRAEIEHLISGFTQGLIPDYQMAAFLMSVYFQGMTDQEGVDLCQAMVDSGDRVDLSSIQGFKVDKHSTGGVGDTTTLVLAPLVASCGGVVAKMTGRELGHTGGTVDKLESIPGMRTELSQEEFIRIANQVRVSLIAQTASLAPADKKIYALRNVTATVDSLPLIAASIMSKKIAAGADGIVLDVKTGSGAFMPRYEDALALARTMVRIGQGAGRRMTALITGMEQPLGRAVGNAVEVQEAIETLGGAGPSDLKELVLELGSEMLLLSGAAEGRSQARARLEESLTKGKGLARLGRLIQAQGGRAEVIENPELLPQPRARIEARAGASGFVTAINALEVGMASKVLGAGRKTKDEGVDPSIGLILLKKVGDEVTQGEPLAILHSDGDQAKIKPALERLLKAYTLGEERVEPPRLFYARVGKDGIEELAA